MGPLSKLTIASVLGAVLGVISFRYWYIIRSQRHFPQSATKVLHIFDFDGTLFKSPMPSTKLWGDNLRGRLIDKAGEGGLGWFQEPATLSPPYVPQHPTEDWWVQDVLQAARNKDAHVTALLTGRTESYRARINELLATQNLTFNHVELKTNADMNTLDFKVAVLSKLISRYSPSILHIYEDRPAHSKALLQFMSEFKDINVVMHDIPSECYPLPEDKERELVQSLLAKYAPAEWQLKPHVAYTGVQITEESRKDILSRFVPPAGWIIICDHITMKMGAIDWQREEEAAQYKTHLGAEYKAKVVAVGKSDQAMAVRVEGIHSTNKIPHITIAVPPGGKAKDSNSISEWTQLKEPFSVSGRVREWTLSELDIPKSESVQAYKVPIGDIVHELNPQFSTEEISTHVKLVRGWATKQKIDLTDQANEQVIRQYVREMQT